MISKLIQFTMIMLICSTLSSVSANSLNSQNSTPKPNANSSSPIPVEFYPATSKDIFADLRNLNNSLQIFNFHIKNQKLNSSSDSVVRFLKLLQDVNSKLPELQKTYNKIDKEREMDKIRDNYSSESNLLQNNTITNNSGGILILCIGVIVVLAVSVVIVWFFV